MASRGRLRRSLASQPVFSLRGRSRGASSTNASGNDTQRRPGSSENSRPDVSTAVVKPTPTPVEGQFTDVQLEGTKTRQSDVITIKVSSLPMDTTTDEIGHYFESKGDNLKVLSAIDLGNGSAEVKIIGYSIEELEWLQKRNHKFKKHSIEIAVVCTLPSDEPLQSFKPLPFGSSTASAHELSGIIPEVIEVTGFRSDDVDTELLEIYFESSKSGGCSNAVVKCSAIAAGIAHIEFESKEVAARVFSKKDHVLHGLPLYLAYVQKPVDEPKDRNKLLISNLPSGIDREHLLLYLEIALEMEETDFTVDVLPDQLALIVFHNDYTVKELEEMIAKIEKKPLKKTLVRVELCRMSRSIEISNVSKHYDDEFLKMYFENHKKSGGGNVTSIDLPGGGKAIVTFEDPEVLDNVIARNAVTIFGENAVLKRRDPFGRLSADLPAVTATTTSPTASTAVAVPLQPFTMKIDPLIAKCIQKSQEGLAESLKHLNVQQLEVNEKEGMITILPTNRTISGWQQECQEIIISYIHSHFDKVEINFPNKAEADVRRCIMKVQDEATLVVIFNPSNTGFAAASDPDTITMLKAKTKEISLHYEQVQEEVHLTAEDYSFFTQVKAQQVAGTHPNISIDYNPTNNALLLRGSVQDVKCFQQLLPECLRHVSTPMQHALVVQYFSTGNGRKQLENFIKRQKKDVSLATHFKQGPQNQLVLNFLCNPANAKAAKDIVKALQGATKEQVHQLPRSFTSLSQADSGEYYQLCQSLEIKQHVQIVTSEANLQLSIGGFSSGVTFASQTLQQFIKDKCTVVKPVEVEKGIWRLFCGLMQSKWDLIVSHCKQRQVELNVRDTPGTDPVILLKGDPELVEEIYQEIITLKTTVASKPILLSRPGTCRYFKEDEKAKTLLSGIEKDHKVCIEVDEVDKVESDSEEFTQVSDSSQFTKVCVARTKEFKQITIYKGDITEYNADVLVNAANGELQHVGGVAKAIADKGGPIIQAECTQRVRRGGRLVDGEVWLTKRVGNLPCKALVHAVGPQWEGGGDKKKAHLSKAIFQSLKQASKYRSIALPAISSGVYGFPIAQCADVLVKAAVDFSEQNPLSELQEINFILFKGTDAEVFVDAIKKHLPVDNIVSEKHPASSAPPFPRVSAIHATVPETSRRKSKQNTRHIPIPDCIQVHRGSLLSITADVYVNTTNTKLDLTQGAVAQTLAKAAGPSLQAECTRKAPVSLGNIAVTRAGNLPSQYILHVVAPSYDGPGGQAEKILRTLIQKCMKECNKLKVNSIAFPALGAGNLHFPSSVVAKIMVGEISSFLAANRNTSLTSVHLVIYMADTYQDFQREISSGKSEASPHSTSKPSRTKSRQSKRPVPTHDATPEHASLGNKIEITMNDIKVQIVHGDITDDSSDAIVNTTNPELQLSGPGVSGALLRKGGKHLQQLCDEERLQGSRLESGEVLVTQATGKLQCKSIFHTIFEDPQKFVKTMNVCLHKAEELQYQSIAFPAVGTGSHACSPQTVARAMMKAIHQFAFSKHSHVACINIVLFDADIHQTFIKAVQDTQPGIWTRTKDWIGSLMWPQSAPDQDNDDVAINSPSATSASHKEMMNRELEFKIYGVNTASVEEAEKKLFKLIDEQFITDEIEDPNVGKLPQSDIAKLEAKSQKMHIEMEVCGAPENCIRLKGDVAELQQLKIDIIQTLSSFEKHESQQREAKNLQKLVQWKRQCSQESLDDYCTQQNYEIEQANLNGQPTYTHNSSTEHYTIDFKKMKEKDHLNDDTCTIVRVDLEKQYREGDRPQSWVPMPTDASGKEEPVHLVDLNPQSEEYKKVQTEFNKTMNPGQMNPATIPVASSQPAVGMPVSLSRARYHPQTFTHAFVPAATITGHGMAYNKIEKIQRVQNPMVYSQYQAKMREMEKQNPPGHKNEWLLWHGTQSSTCQKINIQGFNRSFAGQNAIVYGRGVYFARDASYSARDTYSPRDQNGYKYLYLVRVLVGEYATGNSSMIVPPPKDPSKDPNVLFDSVADNVSNPQVFVVFHDANAYPEYLVVFS